MDYEKCLVELDEVLVRLNDEEYEKIPDEIIYGIKLQKDKEYTWVYDDTKPLKEQNLNRKTIAILSYINMEYLLNDEEKEVMKKIYDFNEQKAELEKTKKYGSDNLFKNKKVLSENNEIAKNIENIENGESTENIKEIKEENKENVSLIEAKEEKWYQKIINKIKSLFSKK